MSSRILPLLILLALPGLTGCVRLATERQVVWAQMGTPARIVDERPVRVLISDGEQGWVPSTGRLTGMVAIDEPTLRYYQQLDARHGRSEASDGR
jgi:hypothetical protein